MIPVNDMTGVGKDSDNRLTFCEKFQTVPVSGERGWFCRDPH